MWNIFKNKKKENVENIITPAEKDENPVLQEKKQEEEDMYEKHQIVSVQADKMLSELKQDQDKFMKDLLGD